MKRLFSALTLLVAGAAAAPLHAQGAYGRSVAVVGGKVYVAEPGNTARPGIVYEYGRSGEGTWAETANLTAPGASAADGFGWSIATDGSTLLASQLSADDAKGVVYVFRREGDTWEQTARLQAKDAAPGDSLGAAVAFDGDRAYVTAVHADSARGAVYVFRRGGDGRWTQESRITPSDTRAGDAFGAAIAASGDRVVVGAPRQEHRRGAAYMFTRDASGAWQETKLLPGGAQAGDASDSFFAGGGDLVGASVALRGDRVLVGAPGHDGMTGTVYIFSKDPESGHWTAGSRLLPVVAGERTGFGAALAGTDTGVFVGAPYAAGFGGQVLQYAADGEDWGAVTPLPYDAERGQAFGSALALDGSLAAVTLGRADYGAGKVLLFQRGAGGWQVADTLASPPESFAAVRGGTVACSGGKAAGFECSTMQLVAFLPNKDIGGTRGMELNDVWGWTDPKTGKEYALVGRMDGTAFVDISDANKPVYVGQLLHTKGARPSIWRDIKTYRNYAFIVSDAAGEHGVQILDLTKLRDYKGTPITFSESAHYDRIHSAHNIVIDTATGFAYSVGNSGGGETCGGGLHMIDIRQPLHPKFAGCFADPKTGRAQTGYTHDAQCVVYHGPDAKYRGHEICFGYNETALSVADVTDKKNPVALSRASYPNVGYTHQGWLDGAQRYLYMDDELDEMEGLVDHTRTLIWDVSELTDPQLIGEFRGSTEAIDHNLYIVGDTMYQSDYLAGLRVIDISDREHPREIGYFDTVPYGGNVSQFGGSWSNYPFFKSGVVIVTSSHEGLFLVKPQRPLS